MTEIIFTISLCISTMYSLLYLQNILFITFKDSKIRAIVLLIPVTVIVFTIKYLGLI